MIFPMVSSVNGFPASGLHAALLKQPGQRRVHPAHPDGSPEPWAVRDVAPQHLHVVAHQRPLPPLSRRSPLSATRSITSVRVSSLECLITLISPSPPPDFAHKPMPVFPVEGDPPVPNPSLCPHVLRSSECVDIYVAGQAQAWASAAVLSADRQCAGCGWLEGEPRRRHGAARRRRAQAAFAIFFSFPASASLFRRIASYIVYMHGGRRASGEAKPARHIPAQNYNHNKKEQ